MRLTAVTLIAVCLMLLWGLCHRTLYGAENGDIPQKRENEYFKSPDYWELTLGDQKDRMESQIEQYCKKVGTDEKRMDYVCGVANSLEKIFKNKYWFKGIVTDSVTVSLAANEREAVQIAVIPLHEKKLKSVRLTVSDLKSPDGNEISTTAFTIYNVCYLTTTQQPAYPTPHVGEWPDPLVSMQPVDIPAAECRAFWVEIRTPKGIKPGAYHGSITVGGENINDTTITVTVKVWSFTLPKEQVVETCTWLNRNLTANKRTDIEQEVSAYRRCCELFLDHKINPIDIGKAFFDGNDYSQVLKNLEWATEKGLRRFEIPRLKGDQLRRFCNALRERNLFDRAMIYAGKDEPHPRDYEAIKSDSAEIHTIEPALKIFLAETPHPDLYGAVDVWWASMAQGNEAYIKTQLQAGNEVWWYRCGIPVRLEYDLPHYYYPDSIVFDRPSLDLRIIYPMIEKFHMTPATFFYAGLATKPAAFDKDSFTWKAGSWPWSGDGYVAYNHEGDFIPSIRLKCIADGIEDFEYINLLKKILPAISDANDTLQAENFVKIPDSLIVYPYYYNRDPRAYIQFRASIGELLSKWSPKYMGDKSQNMGTLPIFP